MEVFVKFFIIRIFFKDCFISDLKKDGWGGKVKSRRNKRLEYVVSSNDGVIIFIWLWERMMN